MRYSPEHKQESRNKVLKAAARAIREQGPEGVSVAAVMGEAGMTHGGFYAHFDSKDALIAASIGYMLEEKSTVLDRLILEKPPREALLAFIDNYLSARHCQARQNGCPFAALVSDAPRMNPESRKAFARGMAQRHQRLAGILRQLGVDEPGRVARSIQSEMLGALVSARLAADPHEREAILSASRQALQQRFQG